MVGSEDGTQRDRQHGHCAETGFAAQTSAGSDEKGVEQVKGSSAAAQDADSCKAEATLAVVETGVLSRQQGGESSGRHKGRAHVSSDESKKSRRRKQNLRDADASSGDKTVPIDTDRIAEGSAQPHRCKDASVHTGKRASRATTSTEIAMAAHAVKDGLPSRKSEEEEDGLNEGASAAMRGSAPGAAVDQSATATKSGEDAMQADYPSAKGSAKGTEAAGLQSDSDPTEAATSSGASSHQSSCWLPRASLVVSHLIMTYCKKSFIPVFHCRLVFTHKLLSMLRDLAHVLTAGAISSIRLSSKASPCFPCCLVAPDLMLVSCW